MNRWRKHAKRNILTGSGGVTLFDVMITCLLLGFLVMAVAPNLQSALTRSKLSEAAVEVLSAVEYAANLAVTHQRPFAVAIDTGENSFKIFDYQYRTDATPHHGANPPSDAYGVVLNPVDKSWYAKDFDTISNYSGVRITSVAPTGEICFYPDGHCGASNYTIGMSFAGEQRTITVNGPTGRITVQ